MECTNIGAVTAEVVLKRPPLGNQGGGSRKECAPFD